MVPDQTEDAPQTSAGNQSGADSMLDTSELSRASQKVDLDLDDAPFLEEEEEVKPEPKPAKEVHGLEQAEEPAPAGRKKLIIIAAAALVLLVAAAFTAKLLFFKGKPAPAPDLDAQTASADNQTAEAPEAPEIQMRLEPFWVEQKGEGDEIRFLTVRILLGARDQNVVKEFTARMLAARNAVFYYLKNKDVQFLTDEKNTEKLRAELLMIINQHVSDGKFETILFEEYVVK